jgi:NADH-quinone oxidoreductase subunit L
LWFWRRHPEHVLLFLGPVFGAGITAFYMFRLYFMTFTGKPRDHHVHDHAHESPAVMWVPLAILAVPSICVGYSFDFGGGAHAKAPLLERILQYRPASAEAGAHVPHELHVLGGNIALVAVVAGIALSSLFYYFRVLKSDEVARQFPALHRFLLARWYFDELYAAVFLRPTLALSRFCRQFDWNVIDSAIDGTASWMVRTSDADGWFDFWIIDGIVNKVSDVVYGTANWLRVLQTGRLRQYVLFLVVGTVGLVAVISYLYPK